MPAGASRPIPGDVETTIRRFERATAQADAEVLLQLVSERFFNQTYGALGVSREALLANPDRVLGQRVTRVVDAIEISGALAYVQSRHSVGDGAVAAEALDLVRQGHGWLIDAIRPTVSQGTSGERAVNVTMRDFTSDVDLAGLSGGVPLRIRARNNGTQPHMTALWHITMPGEPIELIESTDSPPGNEYVHSDAFQPGSEGDILVEQIPPGRYLLVCLLGDVRVPALTPHYDRGMVLDFQVR